MDEVDGFIDAYGNRAHLSSQTRPEPSFAIVASGMVETHDRNGVVGRLERDPVPALFRRTTALTRPAAAIVNRFRGMPKDGSERIGLLHALMARVAEVAGEPAPAQTQTQGTLAQSQTAGAAPTAPDHAHAFIGAARALGIPARYVTGYLVQEDGEGAAFHAWAEAWDDRLGWIGFDATLGLCPTERHVRLAVGLDALTT
ncbi:MAG TPA: transglutaminase family protein, partial [Alphaproteobacteria bacterium]|nr:transglutaminase family protein [Alphaproteobacteria bacterium]